MKKRSKVRKSHLNRLPRLARVEALEPRALLASATITDTSWGAVALKGDGTYATDTLPHAGFWDNYGGGTSGDATWRGWDKYTIPSFSSRPAVDHVTFPWSLTAEDGDSASNWGGGDFRGVWSDPVSPTTGSTWDGMSTSSRFARLGSSTNTTLLYHSGSSQTSGNFTFPADQAAKLISYNRGKTFIVGYRESPEGSNGSWYDNTSLMNVNTQGLTVYYTGAPTSLSPNGTKYRPGDTIHYSWSADTTNCNNIGFRVQMSRDPTFPDNDNTFVQCLTGKTFDGWPNDNEVGVWYWRVQSRNTQLDSGARYGYDWATSDWSAVSTVEVLPATSIAINDPQISEGNSGRQSLDFTVTISNPNWRTGTIAFDYVTADGSATTADNDYETVSGGHFTVTLSGQPTQTVSIPIGVFGDIKYESDETLYVKLKNPVNTTISDDQGRATIKNDDPKPVLSINDVARTEGNSGTKTFTFTVSMTGATALGASVDFATADGTATTADNDYVATSGTLNWAAGDTSAKSISVTVNGDVRDEGNETFYVNLSGENGATVSDSQGLGTIQNDEKPLLSINDVALAEGNSGTKTFTFTVSMSGSNPSGASVNYATADGTATTADNDYLATSGSLAWAAGDTSPKTISVVVNGDGRYEEADSFYVNLSSWNGATVSASQGLGTIQNDDNPPTLSINDIALAEGNSGTKTFTFTVNMTGATALGASVNYATADGTATVADNDYAATNGTLTWAAGDTSPKSINVTVNGDSKDEGNETFFVNLTGAFQSQIFDGQGQATIQNDEKPTLSISDVSLAEGNSGGAKWFSFAVSMAGPNPLGASVNYATADGTATVADNDYAATNGTLTWAAGDTSPKSISVQVNGDDKYEGTEAFYVNLTNASGAIVSDAQGQGTIQDDDRRQIVTPSPLGQTVVAGSAVACDLYYNTNPSDNTLAGLGLRMHFPSSKLAFNQLSNVLSTDFIQQQQPLDDTQDFDNDPSTDKYVPVSWANSNGNWPNQNLPTRLFTANFTTSAAAGGQSAKVNFTSSSTAAGWNLASTSQTITISPALPTVAYFQDFSAGKPGAPAWTYYSTNEGRIAVVSGKLRMDDRVKNNVYSLNEAMLHINLAGVTNPTLKVDHQTFGDSNQRFSGTTFTGHVNADLIAVSIGGNVNDMENPAELSQRQWVKLTDLSTSFTGKTFSLENALRTAANLTGISDRSHVWIKFQQWDRYPWGTSSYLSDGRAFDNIVVNGTRAAGLSAVAERVGATAARQSLSEAALTPVIEAALAQWASAGLSASQLDAMRQVRFAIADLPGAALGQATADTISIDRNAAGNGWFVDRTPRQSEEFRAAPRSGGLYAVDRRAVDRIDLLTVVAHELGHVAGLDDLAGADDGLMNGRLRPGVRRHAEADSLFAQGAW